MLAAGAVGIEGLPKTFPPSFIWKEEENEEGWEGADEGFELVGTVLAEDGPEETLVFPEEMVEADEDIGTVNNYEINKVFKELE